VNFVKYLFANEYYFSGFVSLINYICFTIKFTSMLGKFISLYGYNNSDSNNNNILFYHSFSIIDTI
jgi:hypothetical protein